MARRSSKRRNRGSGTDEIPVSSFSDIAFLIIIFFFVVMVLNETTGFEVEIPAGEKAEQSEDEEITVQVNDDLIYFEGSEIDIFDLRDALLDKEIYLKDPDKRIVMLEESGDVTWQTHTEVMAVIRKAGGVVTKVIEDEEGG